MKLVKHIAKILGLVTLMALVGTLLSAAAPASAAHAADTPGRLTLVRPLPPAGTGWVWAIPTASLPAYTSADKNTMTDWGGWDQNTRHGAGHYHETYRATLPAGSHFKPVVARLSEPMRSTTSGQVFFGIRSAWNGSSGSNDFGSGYIVGTAAYDVPNQGNGLKFTCASSEWSKPSTHQIRSSSNAFQETAGWDGNGRDPNVTYNNFASGTINVTNCPYLVSVYTQLHLPIRGESPASFAKSYDQTWTAENYFRQKPYKIESDAETICKIFQSAECAWINPPDDPAAICDWAPEMAWGNWDWLPDTIAHYSKCLFVPVDRFDRKDVLADQLEESVFGPVGTIIDETTSAFNYSGTCGTVVSADGGPLDGFDINTCDWSGWAPPIKTFLSFALGGLSAWFIIVFFLSTLGGIFSRKTPSPLEKSETAQ